MFRSKNKHVYLSVFISELGDFVFLSSIAIFLLNQGYNAFESSSFIAITTLPNIFLGPYLGKIVDEARDKGFLYLTLTLGLVLLEVLLLYVTGWFDGTKLTMTIPVIFLFMACFYSPYLMLLNHYIVPHIEEKEGDSYANMEIISNIAAVSACFIIGIILYIYDSGYLILFDTISFIISALLLYSFVNKHNFNHGEENSNKNEKIDYKAVFKNSGLLASLLLMYSYGLIVNAIMNNLSAFGIAGLKLDSYIVGGSLGIIASMEFIGSVIYKRFGVNKAINKYKVQSNIFYVYTVLVLLLGIAQYFNSLYLMGASVLLISMSSPFWNTNNKLLLREAIPKGKYGQYFGAIKIPRAFMTFIGTLIFARMIDISHVADYLIFCSLLMIGIILISNNMFHKWKINNYEVQE